MDAYSKFWLRTRVAAVGALVFAAGALIAVAVEPPATLPGATVVSAEQGKTLAELGAPLIDTRDPAEFSREHIAGAVNLPLPASGALQASLQHGFDLAQVAPDKHSPLVFYCGTSECWAGYEASRLAVADGYRQVHWLRGGLALWRAHHYPTAAAVPAKRGDHERAEMAQR